MERKQRTYHGEHRTGMHQHMKPVELEPRQNSKTCGRVTSRGLAGNCSWGTWHVPHDLVVVISIRSYHSEWRASVFLSHTLPNLMAQGWVLGQRLFSLYTKTSLITATLITHHFISALLHSPPRLLRRYRTAFLTPLKQTTQISTQDSFSSHRLTFEWLQSCIQWYILSVFKPPWRPIVLFGSECLLTLPMYVRFELFLWHQQGALTSFRLFSFVQSRWRFL